jgi:sugar O-acyltransferase (sialic acid O-acetyltransferase NeuD family)
MEIINMKAKCIIIGAGTYGQVYKEYLQSYYDVTGYYDDDNTLHGNLIDGVEVKGSVKDAIEKESKTDTSVFVPIGNNPVRIKILKEFVLNGFNTPSFIHENTIIHSSVKIGKAVYILPGTCIMPLSVIGDYTMISVNSTVSHHTVINEGVFISFGVNVGASLKLCELAYVGIGATIMTGVKNVGVNSLIGAGAVVTKDVPDNAVVAGVPAKIIRYKD